jgi:asparagine synthase (glutamine-hydrolysing)
VRADAKRLADHLGIPLVEVELDGEEMVAGFDELARLRDDPIADIAGWGYLQVMRAARAHDTPVMLQGHGGDELFWGYPWVLDAARVNRDRLALGGDGSESARRLLCSAFGVADRRPAGFVRWMRDGWRRYGARRRMAGHPAYPTFVETLPFFLDGATMPYTDRFSDSILNLGQAADPREPYRADVPWGNPEIMTTRMICDTYLRENGIAQGDRLSMAASVELRLPLLDHRLVETVVGLRKAHSDIDLPPKAWLRAAAATILPADVLNRPKRGFSPPTGEWHARIFAQYGRQLVDGMLVQHDIISAAGARALSGGDILSHAIIPASFKALVLEAWLRAIAGEMEHANRAHRRLAT